MSQYETVILAKYDEVVKEQGIKNDNWAIVAEWFESQYTNIGLSVTIDNKDKQQPYITKRKLHLNLRVKSIKNKKFQFIEEKGGAIQQIRVASHRDNARNWTSTALIDKSTSKAFWNGNYCHVNELPSCDEVVRVWIEKRAMEKVTSLKDEMCKRCDKMNAIGRHFGVTDHFYNDFFMCRNLYAKHNAHLHGCEQVDDDELDFLDGSMKGGIMWGRLGETFKDCVKYDINGMIPYILSRNTFKYPLTVGKVTTITSLKELNKDKPYICKLNVTGYHPFFAKTEDGYYTNYQIKLMKLLNIAYTVDQVENNAMIWDDYVDGSTFSYMEELYNMRETNPYVKAISASTWGTLCKGCESERDFKEYKEEWAKYFVSLDQNKGIVKLNFYDREYKFCTARLKTFLWSYARYRLVKDFLLPLINAGKQIHFINIDAFITDCKENEISDYVKFGREFGRVKVEDIFEGTHKIVNLRSIEAINGRRIKPQKQTVQTQ